MWEDRLFGGEKRGKKAEKEEKKRKKRKEEKKEKRMEIRSAKYIKSDLDKKQKWIEDWP